MPQAARRVVWTIETGGQRVRVRVIGVRIEVNDGQLSREILGLAL